MKLMDIKSNTIVRRSAKRNRLSVSSFLAFLVFFNVVNSFNKTINLSVLYFRGKMEDGDFYHFLKLFLITLIPRCSYC